MAALRKTSSHSENDLEVLKELAARCPKAIQELDHFRTWGKCKKAFSVTVGRISLYHTRTRSSTHSHKLLGIYLSGV
eukprot:scaffold659_cov192-Ochromonas_danica.AAC.58